MGWGQRKNKERALVMRGAKLREVCLHKQRWNEQKQQQINAEFDDWKEKNDALSG